MLRYINLYNPRLHSFYHNPVNNGYGRYPNYQDPEWERERAEDRHAQYLHEDADSDEDYLFRPCEKAYFDSWRKQEAIINERRRREAEAQMEEARQREEKRRHIEEARKRQAAEIERNRREHMQHAQHTPSRTPPADHRNSPNTILSPSPYREQAPQPPAPAVEYSQVHHDAASKIQRRYRQQRALRTINNIAAQFEEARKRFILPESIDFLAPVETSLPSMDDEIITVKSVSDTPEGDKDVPADVGVDSDGKTMTAGDIPSDIIPRQAEMPTPNVDDEIEMAANDESLKDIAPRLAYTKQNYSIHEYMEKLNVLLTKLDGAESFGSRKVRDRRKNVARGIEEAAARVEIHLKTVWREHIHKLGERA